MTLGATVQMDYDGPNGNHTLKIRSDSSGVSGRGSVGSPEAKGGPRPVLATPTEALTPTHLTTAGGER